LHLSQSSIKHWKNISPMQWKKKYIDRTEPEDENPAFLLGDLLDTLISQPHLLESRYFIANFEKLPSETECKIIECVYREIKKVNEEIDWLAESLPEVKDKLIFNLGDHRDLILYCCNSEKWQSTWKDDTRVNKIIEKGTDYFDILAEANDRKIISSHLNMQALELVEILKKNKWTKDYLVESEGNELHFQLEIFAEYDYCIDSIDTVLSEHRKIPIKGAIDILRINHKEKTIQIVDVKKAFSSHQFIENVRKFGYIEQLSFYKYLLKFWVKENPQFKDYIIISPINIVIDIADKIPYCYSYTDLDFAIAQYGNKDILHKIFNYELVPIKIKKGWEQLLQDICWHYVTNNWAAPRTMLENGIITLNLIND